MMPTDAQIDAMQRGEAAFCRGAELDANPYPESSRLFDFWSFGWEAGRVDKRKADKHQIKTPRTVETMRGEE